MWGYSLIRTAELDRLRGDLADLERRFAASLDASARTLTSQVSTLVMARDRAELERDQLAREVAELRSAYNALALEAVRRKAPEKPATIDRSVLQAIDGRYPRHAKLARQRLLAWASQQARDGVEARQIAALIADGEADAALEMQSEEV